MSLIPTNYSNSPFQPGVFQDAFIPDQLIGGDLKIVTKNATITGAAALLRGTVLGLVAIGAAGAPINTGTGNGTVTAIVPGVTARVGNYTVRMKSATTFDVIDPFGVQISEGFALGAYGDAQVAFTIAAGGTAFVAGDTITFAVAAATGSYKIALGAATDGSQTPAAILVDNVDATLADAQAGIYVMGEFNANAVILGAGISLAAATIALEAKNIYLKTPITATDPS